MKRSTEERIGSLLSLLVMISFVVFFIALIRLALVL
jgi:hypothetical protein